MSKKKILQEPKRQGRYVTLADGKTRVFVKHNDEPRIVNERVEADSYAAISLKNKNVIKHISNSALISKSKLND